MGAGRRSPGALVPLMRALQVGVLGLETQYISADLPAFEWIELAC
jgi:hypothetical protein